jgi:hypothetical protein
VIANNIIALNQGAAVRLENDTTNVTVESNLFEPGPAPPGTHNITGDPRFVDAQRGVFWLESDSPAIGTGRSRYMPETDFWGRPRAKDRPVDLGCFVFVPALTAPDIRSKWHYNWAYRFAPTAQSDLPDLWALPPGAR